MKKKKEKENCKRLREKEEKRRELQELRGRRMRWDYFQLSI